MSRTGTKSLAKALTILGLDTVHLPTKPQLLANHHAYSDIPVLAYLPQLKLLYPNATIIATTRNYETWLNSCLRHFRPTDNAYFLELRRLVYGTTMPTADDLKHAYHALPLSQAQLIIPLEHPDKWQLLCDFLQLPRSSIAYPHVL